MSKFKEKTQPFVMGVLVGLVIAGGFFIFKLDDYFKELNFYKTFIHTFTSETKTPEHITNKEEQTSAKENKPLSGSYNSKTISKKDSNSITQSDATLAVNNDSSAAVKDSLNNEDFSEMDDVVVRKDEMILSKTVDVINLNPTASRANGKDSMMQKVSGVQDDKISDKQFFNVEFWQSPLNYKGYKMSKYKIVLYGIEESDGIKVFKSEDAVYIKNLANVYKLDYTGDFRAYEKVNDETIVTKLK